MTSLVYGGSGSGKSERAEELLSSCMGPKYYIATMKVYGEEGKARVMRHISLREGKGFITVEKEDNLGELSSIMEGKSIIIECLSNLVANEMFGENIKSVDETSSKVISSIKALMNKASNVILVSNNVYEEGLDYSVETINYLACLNKVNVELAHLADYVYEVVCGINIRIK